MMGGLQVTLRTLSVECRLLRESDAGTRARAEDAAVNISFVQGSAQEPQSGFLGRGRARRLVFKVFFQDKFCSVLRSRSSRTWVWKRSSRFSPRTASGFNSASRSRTMKPGGAVLRREEAHDVPWKPGHYFYEPLDRPDTCARVHTSVNEGFWTNFLRFSMKVDPDPEIVSPSVPADTCPGCVSQRKFGIISRISTCSELGSQRRGRCTGGCRVRSTPLGTSRWDGPPSQGGI